MNADDIQHFLVTFRTDANRASVRRFGRDYDAAQRAYAAAEREHQGDPNYDIVLLSADSLATIKRTHSSYFGAGESTLRELLSTAGSTVRPS